MNRAIYILNIGFFIAGAWLTYFHVQELTGYIPWSFRLDQDAYVINESLGIIQGLPFKDLVHPGFGHKILEAYYLSFLGHIGVIETPTFGMFEADFFGVWQHLVELSRRLFFCLTMAHILFLAVLGCQLLNSFKVFGLIFLGLSQIPSLYMHAISIRPEIVSQMLAVIGLIFILKSSSSKKIWYLLPAGVFVTLAMYTKIQVAPFIVVTMILAFKLWYPFVPPREDVKRILRGCVVTIAPLWLAMSVGYADVIPLPPSFLRFVALSPILLFSLATVGFFLLVWKGPAPVGTFIVGLFVGHLITILLFTPYLGISTATSEALRHLVAAIDVRALSAYTAIGHDQAIAHGTGYLASILSVFTDRIPDFIGMIGDFSFAAGYLILGCVFLPILLRKRAFFECGLIALVLATIVFNVYRSAHINYVQFVDAMAFVAGLWIMRSYPLVDLKPKAGMLVSLGLIATLVVPVMKARTVIEQGGWASENTLFLYAEPYYQHRGYWEVVLKLYPQKEEFMKHYVKSRDESIRLR